MRKTGVEPRNIGNAAQTTPVSIRSSTGTPQSSRLQSQPGVVATDHTELHGFEHFFAADHFAVSAASPPLHTAVGAKGTEFRSGTDPDGGAGGAEQTCG